MPMRTALLILDKKKHFIMTHVIPRILRLRLVTIIQSVRPSHLDQLTRTVNLLPSVTLLTFVLSNQTQQIEKDSLRHMKMEASM